VRAGLLHESLYPIVPTDDYGHRNPGTFRAKSVVKRRMNYPCRWKTTLGPASTNPDSTLNGAISRRTPLSRRAQSAARNPEGLTPEEKDMESTATRTRYIKSSEAARRLGVTTKTLAKWRYEKKGPAGWIYASATLTLYSENAVEAFIRERAGRTPVFNFRRAGTME